MTERNLSRREFIFGALAFGLTVKSEQVVIAENAPVLYRYENGILRVDNTFASENHRLEDHLHKEFSDGSLPAPTVNKGWCTRHGDTAYVDNLVMIIGQELLRQSPYMENHTSNAQNVIKLYQAMQRTTLPENRQTPEYAFAFREMLRHVDFGPEYEDIDVIASGAIKGINDVGRIFTCKVYDRLTGQWVSEYVNPEGNIKKLGLIVMDSQGDDSWIDYPSFQLENFIDSEGNPVEIPWCIEASHDLFSVINIPVMDRPEYIQIEEVIPQLELGPPVFPEVVRRNIVSSEYQVLAQQLSNAFRNPVFTEMAHLDISWLVNESEITTTSDFIRKIIADNWDFPLFSNDSIDNIKAAVQGQTELGVGIPLGSGTQAMLFTLLEESGQIPSTYITRNNQADLQNRPTGYFYTQTYSGLYENRLWHICGMFINTGEEQYFAYVQEDGTVTRLSLEGMIERHFINYDSGQVDLNKRIVIFG